MAALLIILALPASVGGIALNIISTYYVTQKLETPQFWRFFLPIFNCYFWLDMSDTKHYPFKMTRTTFSLWWAACGFLCLADFEHTCFVALILCWVCLAWIMYYIYQRLLLDMSPRKLGLLSMLSVPIPIIRWVIFLKTCAPERKSRLTKDTRHI